MKDLTNGYRSGVTEVEYFKKSNMEQDRQKRFFLTYENPLRRCNATINHDMQKLLEYDSKIFIQVAALSLNLLVAR